MVQTVAQPELLQDDAAFLRQLRARFAPKPSQDALIDEGLRVLEWVVQEMAKGRTICSCRRGKVVEEFQTVRTFLTVIRD